MSQVEWLLELTSRQGGRADRGKQYFEDGRVRKVTLDDRYVRAEVIGSQVYEVQVSLTPVHTSSCSCPDEALPCKHVYALAHHVNQTPSLAKQCRERENEFEPGRYDPRLDAAPPEVSRFLATMALRSHPCLEALLEPTAYGFLRCIEENARYRESESHLGTTPHLYIEELDLVLEALALLQSISPAVVQTVSGWGFVAWAMGLEKDYEGSLPEEWIWEDFPVSPRKTAYYDLPRFVSDFHQPDLAEERLKQARKADSWQELVTDK
ncbi:MAG: SWIM zinc finger family protein [Thermoplasmatota archaeon]